MEQILTNLLGNAIQHTPEGTSVRLEVSSGGLGLPLSRRLARLLGGDVVAVATSGAGGEFRLELPASTPS